MFFYTKIFGSHIFTLKGEHLQFQNLYSKKEIIGGCKVALTLWILCVFMSVTMWGDQLQSSRPKSKGKIRPNAAPSPTPCVLSFQQGKSTAGMSSHIGTVTAPLRIQITTPKHSTYYIKSLVTTLITIFYCFILTTLHLLSYCPLGL